MPKTTKKQPPTRPSGQRKNKRSRPARSGIRSAHTAVCSKLCALSNPFDPQARGSRWPDGNAGQTLPTSLEGSFTITTDANGNYAMLFTPGLDIYPCTVNNTTGQITLGTPVQPAGFNSWYQVASEYRIVTAGVEVVPTISQLSAQGLVRVIQVPSAENVGTFPLNAYSFLYPKVLEKPVRETGVVSSQFLPGGPESRSFQEFINSANTFDWSCILVCITGGPASTTIGRSRYLYNLELKFGASSVFNTVGSAKVKADPAAVTGTNWLLDKASSIVEGSRKQIEDQVRSQAESVVRDLIKSNSSMLPFPLNIVGNTLAMTM